MLNPQTSEEWGSLVITAIGAVLLLGAVWKWLSKDSNSNPPATVETTSHDSLCSSPDCVRCRSGVGGESSELKEKLLSRCYDYATSVCGVSIDEAHQYIAKHYPRIMDMINNSIECKDDMLKKVYRESGYTETELSPSHPHIWMIPGLTRTPFWSTIDNRVLNQTVMSVFENSETLEIISQEYLVISKQERGWKTNTIPTGRWRVFPLINQGNKIEDNCIQCSRTVQVIQSLPNFMHQCVYGNAMFSVLEAGSIIEPHTGPCNYRLRCHLPLVTSEGCSIQVGTECQSWKEGKVMVFDDSYVHTVRYDVKKRSEDREQKSRVLLIFDIWHPDVEESEQNILARLF